MGGSIAIKVANLIICNK